MNQKKEEIRAILTEFIGNIMDSAYSVDKEGNIDTETDIQIEPITYNLLINEFTDLLFDVKDSEKK